MCGGTIEYIPCSHVGHIFRPGHPYNMSGENANDDVHGWNSMRLAETWMDEYKVFLNKDILIIDACFFLIEVLLFIQSGLESNF